MTNYKIIVNNLAQSDLVITKDNKILLVDKGRKPALKVYLGPATKDRVDLLIDNLQRLKVHCS